jgi:undecaprenyl-diphosphatase
VRPLLGDVDRTRLSLCLVVGAGAFALLTWVVTAHDLADVDRWARSTLSAAPGTTWARVASWVSIPGTLGVALALAVAASAWTLLRRHDAIGALYLLAGPLVTGLVTFALKAAVDRSPPGGATTADHGSFLVDKLLSRHLLDVLHGDYPSGHAAMSSGLAFAVLVVAARGPLAGAAHGRARTAAGVLAALVIATVGLSRVVVRAHFLTDVVAGVLTGVVVTFAVALAIDAAAGAARSP